MGLDEIKVPELTTLCYIERDGSYLMMHRTKKEKDINKDKWIGIGGHFEYGESPDECLLREVDEETGEIIELGKVPVYLDPETNLYRIYDLTTWPAIDGSLCQIIQQNIITDGVYNILYNIPVMIGSQAMNMRCVYWFNEGRFEIQGLWEDYDSDSSRFNRNVQSLSALAGREFNLLYTVQGSKEKGKASYILSEPETIYPVLDVEITTLPPGTYYLSFSLKDILMREMPIDTVEFTWDGQNFTINTPWEGTQRLYVDR